MSHFARLILEKPENFVQDFFNIGSSISCSFVLFSKIAERRSGSKVTVITIGVGYQLVSINPHGLMFFYNSLFGVRISDLYLLFIGELSVVSKV